MVVSHGEVRSTITQSGEQKRMGKCDQISREKRALVVKNWAGLKNWAGFCTWMYHWEKNPWHRINPCQPFSLLKSPHFPFSFSSPLCSFVILTSLLSSVTQNQQVCVFEFSKIFQKNFENFSKRRICFSSPEQFRHKVTTTKLSDCLWTAQMWSQIEDPSQHWREQEGSN